jgi:hypothetical protein
VREEDAASIVKRYELRLLIKNSGFRELEKAAYLKHLPWRKGAECGKHGIYAYYVICLYPYFILCLFAIA